MQRDYLTILESKGPRLAKTHTWSHAEEEWSTQPYDRAKHFRCMSRRVDGIGSLHRVVSELKSEREKCIIRAGLKEGMKPGRVVRRLHGDDAPFQPHPVGRRWAMIDLDDAPAPDWLEPDDPGSREEAVEFAIDEYLPPSFHGVTVSYHWSGSAGIKGWDELRLHLWYWLDRPAYDESIEEWLKDEDCVDHTVFRSVQMHYTAAPVCKAHSPPLSLSERSELLEGDRHEVELPDDVHDGTSFRECERLREQERKRQRRERLKEVQRRRRRETYADTASAKTRYARSALDHACRAIIEAEVGSRHNTILSESTSIFGLVKGGHLAHDEALARLEEAASASFGADEEPREIERLMKAAERYADPRRLEDVTSRSGRDIGSATGGGERSGGEGPSHPSARPHAKSDRSRDERRPDLSDGSAADAQSASAPVENTSSSGQIQSILDRQRYPSLPEGVTAPWRTAASPRLREELSAAPIRVQRRWRERVAIMHYHGDLPLQKAEVRAWEDVRESSNLGRSF